MGYKVFQAFTKLTADDVNNYLMEQTIPVFTDSTDRSTQLTTPVTGAFSYLTTTQKLEVYSGTAWVYATGLTPIVPASVAISGGTGSVDSKGLVSFSQTAYIRLNGVFDSSLYSKYLAFIEKTSGTTTASQIQITIGTSTTQAGDSNITYDRLAIIGGTTALANSTSFGGSTLTITPTTDFVRQIARVEIINPNIPQPTLFNFDGASFTSPGTSGSFLKGHGIHNTGASYTAINFKASGGTFSGTVSIYGYN